MKKLLISVLLLTATAVQAQKNDPVIMKVAGVDVPRSEFEYSYNKNNTDGVIDKKTVEEYVDLFVNYKLKVQAALDARIDTTTAFLNEFAQYRDQQIRPTFVTDDDMLAEAHNVYDQTVKNIGPDGLVQASHILILIPQKATEAQQQDAKRRIDSVYTALKAGADFEALAKQVSQDPGSAQRGGMLGWFSRNQMVKEFEDVAFSLQPGEMSVPFLSSFGWHIILQKDRKQFEPFDFHRENILKYLEQRNARNYITEQKLDAIVKASNGSVTKAQLLEQRADSLSAVDPEMRYLIKEYHDGLLLYEISNQTIWDKAAKDEEALSSYFKKNKKKYKWDEPRFKGMAYHVKQQSDVKAVANCVKKLKFDEWNEALRKTFNNDSIIRIRVEKGLFKKGDNKLIDREVFKVNDTKVDSVKGYPIDATYGKLIKKPQDYTDVRPLVTADLQDELERHRIRVEHINVGGGLGVDYEHPNRVPIPDFKAYFDTYAKMLRLRPGQTLHFELGRAVVAQCGSLITRTLYIKEGATKKFAIVDAGFTDLIRPALYQAYHKIENLTSDEPMQAYDVVGPICESTDVFAKQTDLNACHRGDLLAIRSAGAYGEIMASGYNCRQLPKGYTIDTL